MGRQEYRCESVGQGGCREFLMLWPYSPHLRRLTCLPVPLRSSDRQEIRGLGGFGSVPFSLFSPPSQGIAQVAPPSLRGFFMNFYEVHSGCRRSLERRLVYYCQQIVQLPIRFEMTPRIVDRTKPAPSNVEDCTAIRWFSCQCPVCHRAKGGSGYKHWQRIAIGYTA